MQALLSESSDPLSYVFLLQERLQVQVGILMRDRDAKARDCASVIRDLERQAAAIAQLVSESRRKAGAYSIGNRVLKDGAHDPVVIILSAGWWKVRQSHSKFHIQNTVIGWVIKRKPIFLTLDIACGQSFWA